MTTEIPPQDLKAEIYVLGGILIDDRAIKKALEVIDRPDFYRESNRKIFAAMMALHQKKEPIDIITLCDSMKSFGILDDVGGPAYVSSLTDGVATAANIKHYCKIIKEKALARTAITMAHAESTKLPLKAAMIEKNPMNMPQSPASRVFLCFMNLA